MGKKKAKDEIPGQTLISKNRKARHDYKIGETFEAGVVLVGTEVKACREGKAHLTEAYVQVMGLEVFMLGSYIGEYTQGNRNNHETDRTRKLLLNRNEIDKLAVKVRDKGFTIVPLSMYFKNGRVKVEIALAKGQDREDQRHRIKERDARREIDRAMKNARRR